MVTVPVVGSIWGCPESDQISPGPKMVLWPSFGTSSAQLSLGNLQQWEFPPFPAAASVLPSQVMQLQVIALILFISTMEWLLVPCQWQKQECSILAVHD